ncbi:MAG: hypothetical protein PHI85_02315 [Victivallaceae bacterium]|nr:hypothetical protein [Victivallaceae bacterium]
MEMNEIIAKAVHERLSAEECARLAEFCTDGEKVRHELVQLKRRARIAEIAGDRRFSDPDYLDYLAGKNQIDLDDPAKVDAFMTGLAATLPGFFTLPLASGAGGGNENPASGGVQPENTKSDGGAPSGPRNVNGIARLLETAPEIL